MLMFFCVFDSNGNHRGKKYYYSYENTIYLCTVLNKMDAHASFCGGCMCLCSLVLYVYVLTAGPAVVADR